MDPLAREEISQLNARLDHIENALQAMNPSGYTPWVPPPVTHIGGVPEHIVELARSGKKIEAIKRYRELTGMGLKEAKHAVERAE